MYNGYAYYGYGYPQPNQQAAGQQTAVPQPGAAAVTAYTPQQQQVLLYQQQQAMMNQQLTPEQLSVLAAQQQQQQAAVAAAMTGLTSTQGNPALLSAMAVTGAGSTMNDGSGMHSAVDERVEEDDEDEEEYYSDKRRDKNRLDVEHNENYNLDALLARTIRNSDYFKSLYRFTEFQEVCREGRKHVRNLEPFLIGLSRKPSTAFSILYKWFTLALTVRQVRSLIEDRRHPLLRGLSFLYLRYVASPKTLWKWFEPYFDDEQPIVPGADGNAVSIGRYVKDLLIEDKYFKTMLPRIPSKIHHIYKKGLMRRKIEKQRDLQNERFRDRLFEGMRVQAEWIADRKWYDAVIDEILDNDHFLVTFVDYGNQSEISIGQIKLKRNTHDHGNDEDPRGRGRYSHSHRRDKHREYSRSRSRGRHSSGSGGCSGSSGVSGDSTDATEIDLSNLDELIRKEERDKALAKGSNYARRPTSYYHSLTLPHEVSTVRKRSKSPELKKSRMRGNSDHSGMAGSSGSVSSEASIRKEVTKKPEISEEERFKRAAKRQALMAVYGDASTHKG